MQIRKVLITLLFLFLIFLFTASKVSGIYDPTSVDNNRFGIHIANTQDLEDAAKLVNSKGGDWGYVTLVITEKDREIIEWQKTFDQMRRLHLIPILRIATAFDGTNWLRPNFNEIDSWVSFLNSLNWVIKNRYLIIGNEVNYGKEWGGSPSPEEYVSYLKIFTKKLKEANSDYFILQSGFDASLLTGKNSLNEAVFIKRMLTKEPDVFELIDGWSSHSYPNPNFSGSENATGRGTVRTFDWELTYLKSLGVKKDLPVFITETGWAHKVEGNKRSLSFFNENELFKKFEQAFGSAWSDKRIVAVTPFILNYEQPPFDVFSWKNNGSFNNLYDRMLSFIKGSGRPVQEDRAEVSHVFVPPIKLSNSGFLGRVLVKNLGQSAWQPNDLTISDALGNNFEIEKTSYSLLMPGESGSIFFKGLTPPKSGIFETSVFIKKDGKTSSNSKEFKILIISPLKMKLDRVLNSIKALFGFTKI